MVKTAIGIFLMTSFLEWLFDVLFARCKSISSETTDFVFLFPRFLFQFAHDCTDFPRVKICPLCEIREKNMTVAFF